MLTAIAAGAENGAQSRGSSSVFLETHRFSRTLLPRWTLLAVRRGVRLTRRPALIRDLSALY
jgi:hypothetical protein